MQRPMRRPGQGPARRPAGPGGQSGPRPQGRGRPPQRMPGRGPARRPAPQQPVRRALRPHDGRTAIFVAGSPKLHKFVVSRLAERTDMWIAQALSQRNYAQGTVFRMKPDVTIVDIDPIWNPTGLPLAKAVTEACPETHVIIMAPAGYPQSPMIAAAAEEPGWSTVLRRKADNGERLLQAIVAGLGGGNDEREQTLNQLLVEMDGFEANEGVILIAATNRPDVLDPALLRPGRFDRQVVVPNPDIIGRDKILKVHMRKVPLAPDVDARTIARGTPGFSGADLMNLVNEAALLAARRSKRLVMMTEFEDAKDKVTPPIAIYFSV